jgi:hypothetical protein
MSCESLGNLCAIQMYSDERKVNPCRVFKDYRRIPTSSDADRLPLPWIYYGEGDASIAMNRKKITFKYSIRPGSHVCICKCIILCITYRLLTKLTLSSKCVILITYDLCRSIASRYWVQLKSLKRWFNFNRWPPDITHLININNHEKILKYC